MLTWGRAFTARESQGDHQSARRARSLLVRSQRGRLPSLNISTRLQRIPMMESTRLAQHHQEAKERKHRRPWVLLLTEEINGFRGLTLCGSLNFDACRSLILSEAA